MVAEPPPPDQMWADPVLGTPPSVDRGHLTSLLQWVVHGAIARLGP